MRAETVVLTEGADWKAEVLLVERDGEWFSGFRAFYGGGADGVMMPTAFRDDLAEPTRESAIDKVRRFLEEWVRGQLDVEKEFYPVPVGEDAARLESARNLLRGLTGAATKQGEDGHVDGD